MRILLVALGAGTAAAACPLTGDLDLEFCEDQAHLFYKLASSAPCSTGNLSEWTCLPCKNTGLTALSGPTVFNDTRKWPIFTGARGYVGAFHDAFTHKTMIVMAFQGSVHPENYLEDFHAWKVPDRSMPCIECKVHAGFYDSWKAISDPMIVELRTLRKRHPFARVYLTGHSLGGAIAMLASYELIYENKIPVAGVYTFGQPRVGNEPFQKFYNEHAPRVTWRLTHCRDPVPHVPTETMGFHHIGTEVWYNQNWTTHMVCDGSGEDPRCSNNFTFMPNSTLWQKYKAFNFSDHVSYFNEKIGVPTCTIPQVAPKMKLEPCLADEYA